MPFRKLVDDGFPDMPATVQHKLVEQQHTEGADHFLGDRRQSGFLQEASQAFQSLASSASPYVVSGIQCGLLGIVSRAASTQHVHVPYVG